MKTGSDLFSNGFKILFSCEDIYSAELLA
jgi:hypothetical protein